MNYLISKISLFTQGQYLPASRVTTDINFTFSIKMNDYFKTIKKLYRNSFIYHFYNVLTFPVK